MVIYIHGSSFSEDLFAKVTSSSTLDAVQVMIYSKM